MDTDIIIFFSKYKEIYNAVMRDDVETLKRNVKDVSNLSDYLDVAIVNNRINVTKYLIETFHFTPKIKDTRFLSKEMKNYLKIFTF